MTDEIIKAFNEYCKGVVDGYYDHISHGGKGDEHEEKHIDMICGIRDIINRQKAENEELKCRNQNLTSDLTSAKAEIEKLKRTPKCVYAYDGETMEYCVEGPCSAEKLIETIKTEAYKEFADAAIKRICERVVAPIPSQSCIVESCNKEIYNTLKELAGVRGK